MVFHRCERQRGLEGMQSGVVVLLLLCDQTRQKSVTSLVDGLKGRDGLVRERGKFFQRMQINMMSACKQDIQEIPLPL